MTREEQIAAFIARKGVTKCPPSEQAAPSLRELRLNRERMLTKGDCDMGDREVQEMERGAQARYLEIQGVRE